MLVPAAIQPARPLPQHDESSYRSFLALKRNPLSWLMSLSMRYPIVEVRLGRRRLVVVHQPEHVQHILIKNARNYTKQTRGYQMIRKVLGNGLVTSEGDFWMRQRRIAQPAFHRKRLAMLGEGMVKATQEMVEGWGEAVARREVVEVNEAMMGLTLRIVGEALLGVDVTGASSQVGDAVEEVLEFVAVQTRSLPLTDALPTPSKMRFRRSKAVLDQVVQGIIDERRADDRDRGDLLSMFMAVQDEETGERMTDGQLHDEVMTMFLAGHETTAMTLTWTLMLLSQHPAERRRVVAELAEVLEGRAPTIDDLGQLPFLERVIKESMRLYPPVPMVARTVVDEDEIDGWRLNKDHYVVINTWATHRSPEYWDNPEGFDPDRFLPERFDAVPKLAYSPFSAGQRKCIGDNFAMMEARLVLATLLQQVELDLAVGQTIVPEAHVTLRPATGLKMRLGPAPRFGR